MNDGIALVSSLTASAILFAASRVSTHPRRDDSTRPRRTRDPDTHAGGAYRPMRAQNLPSAAAGIERASTMRRLQSAKERDDAFKRLWDPATHARIAERERETERPDPPAIDTWAHDDDEYDANSTQTTWAHDDGYGAPSTQTVSNGTWPDYAQNYERGHSARGHGARGAWGETSPNSDVPNFARVPDVTTRTGTRRGAWGDTDANTRAFARNQSIGSNGTAAWSRQRFTATYHAYLVWIARSRPGARDPGTLGDPVVKAAPALYQLHVRAHEQARSTGSATDLCRSLLYAHCGTFLVLPATFTWRETAALRAAIDALTQCMRVAPDADPSYVTDVMRDVTEMDPDSLLDAWDPRNSAIAPQVQPQQQQPHDDARDADALTAMFRFYEDRVAKGSNDAIRSALSEANTRSNVEPALALVDSRLNALMGVLKESPGRARLVEVHERVKVMRMTLAALDAAAGHNGLTRRAWLAVKDDASFVTRAMYEATGSVDRP